MLILHKIKMNDVSLTGILNEFQSPDKQQHHTQHTNKNTTLVHVLNENSRDSIFFNVIKNFLFFCYFNFNAFTYNLLVFLFLSSWTQ